MNYWIIALPREDMEHCIRIGSFGLGRKYQIGRAKQRDRVVCYISKEHKVIALGELTSDNYLDNKKIFKNKEDIFPYRFDFKAKQMASTEELDFRKMVEDLSFITNKYYWSVYLRNGIVQIPEKDWNVIVKFSKQPALS